MVYLAFNSYCIVFKLIAMRYWFVFVALFFCMATYNVAAQQIAPGAQTKFRGVAKQYRGMEIRVLTRLDPLSKTYDTLAVWEPNDEGGFEFTISIDKPTRIEMPLLALTGVFYAEPGQSYNLVLPERIEPEKVDEYNPFFVAADVLLGTQDGAENELTNLIGDFEVAVKERIVLPYAIARGRMGQMRIEGLIDSLEMDFKGYKAEYFAQYREFRYHTIRFSTYLRNKETIMKKYFEREPLWNVPTYWLLFDMITENGLTQLSLQKDSMVNIMLAKPASLSELRKRLAKQDFLQHEEFRDLFIIKGLYDAFWNSNLPKKSLIKLLDVMQTDAASALLRSMAKNVSKELTRLMPGEAAPELILVGEDQQEIRLSNYRGKYVYLNFGASWSVAFQKELKLMKALYDNRVPDFEIITVSMDNDFGKMKQLATANGYSWIFGHYNFDPSVAHLWNVKVYPTYYLIGPDGNFVFSPAPWISENFRDMFQPILDEMRRQKYRRDAGLKH